MIQHVGGLRQEDQEFKLIFCYIVNPEAIIRYLEYDEITVSKQQNKL